MYELPVCFEWPCLEKNMFFMRNFTHMKFPEICLWGDTETFYHIYSCILLNNNKSEEPFKASQIKAYRRLSEAITVKLEHFIE